MRVTIIFLLLISIGPLAIAQTEDAKGLKNPPRYQFLRAFDDFSYLKNDSVYNSYKKDFFDPIKRIPLNKSKSNYLTFGGELRVKHDFYRNTQWGDAEDDEYGVPALRAEFHANMVLGEHFRFYGSIISGSSLVERVGFSVSENDAIDLFQLFAEVKIPVSKQQQLSFRVGRQEMPFGSTRMVGVKEAFNVRRSFDAAKSIYSVPEWRFEGFYAKEVVSMDDGFDNRSENSPDFFGLYITNTGTFSFGNADFYYFGYQRDQGRFEEGISEEKRHTIGTRMFGKLKNNLSYNTEINYQFGSFGTGKISAFSIETDFNYKFSGIKFTPNIGLKIDYLSGDKNKGDGDLQSYNALYPNGSYFGFIGAVGPTNIFDVHPSLTLFLSDKINVIADCDIFWRNQKEDGLYSAPNILLREGSGSDTKFLGTQVGFATNIAINRHLSFGEQANYFFNSDFFNETGADKNLFHIVLFFTYKF